MARSSRVSQPSFGAKRSYAATPNQPAVKLAPAPQAPIGKPVNSLPLPSLPTPKKRKRRGLRFLVGSVLLLSGFYGGSVVGSQYSERYRDFFLTEVPMAEPLLTLYEDKQMDKELIRKLSERAKLASGKNEEVLKQRAERMAQFTKKQAEQAKVAAEKAAAEAKEKASSLAEHAKQAAASAKQEVKSAGQTLERKAGEAVEAVKEGGREAVEKGKEVVGKGEELAHDAKEDVKEALPSKHDLQPKETLPVDYQRPRQLDASPQPPKEGNKELYEAPLPVGFEPPPGYAVPKPVKAGTAAPAPAPVAKPAPKPLPLVAPTVSELSASEPVLGQLASTIDSLANYLNDSPAVVGDKGAREVLSTATIDLQNLGKRLEDVKVEERKRLEAQLEEKTKEYSAQLHKAERELATRLETQEDDWRSTFEKEQKELVAAYREKLDGELAVQKELIEQRLKEEVVAQGVELQRRWLSEVKQRVEEERNGRLGKLESLQDNFEKLEKTTLENSSWLEANREVNRLWTAVRAAWQASVDGLDGTSFEKEFTALHNVARKTTAIASDGNPESTVDTVLATIPESVKTSGVETFPTLSSWFTDRLVPKIRKASLLPPSGGFMSYVSSSLLSGLLFQKVGFVQGEDVISTLSRAEWYLTHRDLESAAREVNQLTGWPKILARDWLEAARRHLEVRQALQVVEAEAGLATLLIL